ncbi:MAG TPA: enterotoxin, partial [Rhodanobacteraceae bacterium]|nr:enterotoxin [Rhodanobacteraceae bacterium]
MCAALVTTAAFAQGPHGAPAPPSQLGNDVIAAAWKVQGGALSGLVVTDRRHHVPIAVTDPFSMTLKDGSTIGTGGFRLHGSLREAALPADADAARLVERIPGKAVKGTFLGPKGNLRVDWKLVQRDGSDYLREIVTITALNEDAPIAKVSLFGANAPDAVVDGSVDGSPVLSHDDWLGFEHPMSKADAW